MIRKYLIAVFMLLGLSLSAQFPERPNPPRAVNDFVGILSPSQANDLEQRLRSFTKETSTAIVIAIVDDLHGMDYSDFAIELAHKWGVGQKGKDNGIMIMVKPTGGKGQRRAFIAVGYGLEAVVPDAIANRIVDNEMIPYFKQGDYYKGLLSAVTVLMDLTRGEYTADQYDEKVRSKTSSNVWKFLAVILLSLVFAFFNSGRNAYHYARANNMGFWAAFFLLMSSGSHSGSYNRFTGGYGGFGGFGGGGSSGFGGGGGFGGFGGGGFGGGGAGGSW